MSKVKIIDGKGKFLGIINLIDLLVLIIVAVLVIAVGYRLVSARMNAGGGSPLDEEKDVYVTLYASLVVPEVAQSLHPGDKLVANNAFTDAEIVSISRKKADYVSADKDGNPVLSQHPLWDDVRIVIKDKVNPASVILKVANQECRVGNPFIVKTPTVETNCRVRSISYEEPENPAMTMEDKEKEIEKNIEEAQAQADAAEKEAAPQAEPQQEEQPQQQWQSDEQDWSSEGEWQGEQEW